MLKRDKLGVVMCKKSIKTSFCGLIMAILALMAAQVEAATVYVDPVNGSDTNSGSSDYAYQTITKALAEVSLGDTIVLKDGQYGYLYYEGQNFEGDVNVPLPSDTKWITIRAENKHQAVINYEENQARRCVDLGVGYGHNGTTKFIGLIFEDIAFNGKFYTNEIMGLRVENCLSYSNDNFLDMHRYESGFALEGGDIVISNTEVKHHRKGITASGNNIQLIGNDIHDIGVHHIYIGGVDSLLIDDNIIRDHSKYDDSHGDAIIFYSFGPMENITIRNNKFYNHINLGIYISYADTMLLKNFVFENNLMYNITGYALTLQHIENGKIANNTIIGSVRFGSDAAHDMQNLEIFNNIFYKYYVHNYDPSYFSYNDNNIYVTGAGGGGYTNLGQNEVNSFGYAKDTSFENVLLFNDYVNGDYTLIENSKALNFGRVLNAPVVDILGNYRDSAPDAGCYEYISAGGGNEEPTPEPEPVPEETSDPVELTLQTVPIQNVTEGDTIQFDVVASVVNAELSEVSFAIEDMPAGATFVNNHFEWITKPGDSGIYLIKITATCQDVNDSIYVALNIAELITSHQPSFNIFEGTSVFEAEKLTVAVSATDPDGDDLTIEAYNLPEGAIFYDNKLIWVPEYGDAGTYIVEFSVDDGQYIVSETIDIVVKPVDKESYPGRRLIYYWNTTLSLLGEI